MNKKINKEIMKRSRLRNNFLNTRSDIDRKSYNKQRNLCVCLIRSERKNFFSNINTIEITDNKTLSKITLSKKKSCLPGRSRGNSFRKNNNRRSG